ncbi:unnamed protein product [Triticum turgidum subsp. durum]|uniref:Exostosin GT47 domain-containing protein n=1 Tax=Triticum turgidum subsp. durum TaxID=4567 RepID=A0A9R0RBE5_TRITD|nr:unnamed protein product [Triticum turgidum subsp. durum]
MKPFSRSLQWDLDAAVDDDDGKQHCADEGDGKQNTERGLRRPSRLFYLALLYTVFWALVFYHHFSTSVQQSGSAAVGAPTVLQLKPSAFFSASRFFRRDPCAGRYVYMYDLPPRFNADLVSGCRRVSASSDVCKDVSHDGFGPPITGGSEGGSLPEQGAYDTDQFMLSIIFHARMRRDYRSYSVFIPHRDVVDRNVSIEEVLRRIPPEKVAQMRERVIQLIPTVMYRHPAAKGVTFKDAFDVALDRVVDRVAKRRRAAAEGREYVDGVDGADSWKYDLLEDGQTKVGPHEFDQYL